VSNLGKEDQAIIDLLKKIPNKESAALPDKCE
jgi:hypothetical protein